MTPAPLHSQIVTEFTELAPLVERFRQAGQRIVLTQGVFDLVHIGHARYCQVAKQFGDVLIVGVDSDEKVRARKGPDRPVVPQAERMEMVAHLAAVDVVVLKQLDEPKWKLIKTVKPDVLVATQDTYTPEQVAELQKICGRVVVLEPMATTSTSAKLRRLQIGAAQKISDQLSQKLIETIENVLAELKGERPHVRKTRRPRAKAKR